MIYAYCEAVTASGRSPWHLRQLTDVGRRLSGGVDTPSLCGHVKPPMGWDLPMQVQVDALLDRTCKRCAEVLAAQCGVS